MPAPKRANTAPATAARLAKMAERAHSKRVQEAIDLLRADDYIVINPGGCPAHGLHPHKGMKCLDCPICGLEKGNGND